MADWTKGLGVLEVCLHRDRLMAEWLKAFGAYSSARLSLSLSKLLANVDMDALTENVERTARKTEAARLAFIVHRVEHGCSVG